MSVLTLQILHAQVTRVELAGRPQLVSCGGQACLRLTLNGLDDQGLAVPFDADAAFRVLEADREHDVFYQQGLTANEPGQARSALVLVDTSGSMLEPAGGGDTKFDLAKRAIVGHYVEGFEDGIDHVAVVPFDSRNVVSRVRQARFETSLELVRRAVDGLPSPAAAANTALYSAMRTALEVVADRISGGGQFSLVVLTDGDNDVGHDGDDLNLLGDEGLPEVQRLAADLQIVQVVTIGFGQDGVTDLTFDDAALQALAFPPGERNYYTADDLEELGERFRLARAKLVNRVVLAVGPVRRTPEELTNRSLGLEVRLGDVVTQVVWEAPLVGPAVFRGSLLEAEAQAFRPVVTRVPQYRLAVLAAYVTLLAVCWFGLPRLVWPRRRSPGSFASAPTRTAPMQQVRPESVLADTVLPSEHTGSLGGVPRSGSGETSRVSPPPRRTDRPSRHGQRDSGQPNGDDVVWPGVRRDDAD